MPYVTREQIEQAKQMDLLTYLQSYEPDELVHFSDNVYTTRTHDSLKISNGKWCWWSMDIGGRSALDYLIKVRDMSLPEAVIRINGQAVAVPPVPFLKTVKEVRKVLLLPERNDNNNRVIQYLVGRGINRDIIDYCIKTRRLYESRENHNAVFVGLDIQGVPQYAMLRGTSSSRFMGDVAGSDKRYSFSIPPEQDSSILHLFESAIDLISFGTLELLSGRSWRQDHCLSLAGIYRPKQNMKDSTLPVALLNYLQHHSQIKTIAQHLDNDVAGRLATETIYTVLSSTYTLINRPAKQGKDMNDYLMLQVGVRRQIVR